MRNFLLVVSTFVFGVQAQAADTRYRTLQELRMAGQLQLTCKSQRTDPQTNISFRFGFTPIADSLGMAVIWPDESMWVRELKSDPTYPVWARDFGGSPEVVSFTGTGIPTNEAASVKIEQASGGRFKATVSYIHRVTNERLDVSDLRCIATNHTRVLGQ